MPGVLRISCGESSYGAVQSSLEVSRCTDIVVRRSGGIQDSLVGEGLISWHGGVRLGCILASSLGESGFLGR